MNLGIAFLLLGISIVICGSVLYESAMIGAFDNKGGVRAVLELGPEYNFNRRRKLFDVGYVFFLIGTALTIAGFLMVGPELIRDFLPRMGVRL